MHTLTTGQASQLREKLLSRNTELAARLERIKANVTRPLDADSKERAVELENSEVVDALGNEARSELAKVKSALERMSAGNYGHCKGCGSAIEYDRLSAYPAAADCIECATARDKN